MIDADELNRAVGNYHLHNMADMITWAIGMAAEKYPAELRESLRQVFSSDATEEMARRAFNMASEAQKVVAQVRSEWVALSEQIHRQLNEIDRRLDGINYELDRKAGNGVVPKAAKSA